MRFQLNPFLPCGWHTFCIIKRRQEKRGRKLTMIGFNLKPEEEQLRQMARKFAENEIAPARRYYHEHEEEIPMPILKKGWELGLAYLNAPARIQKSEISWVASCVILEELARGSAGISNNFAANCLGSTPCFVAGNEMQQDWWFGRIVNEGKWAAFCLTEPGAGTDVSSMQTRVEKDGDYYYITGEKIFASNGRYADQVTVFGCLEPKNRKTMCAFLVDTNQEGVTRGPWIKKMGLNANHQTSFYFDHVKVHKDMMLGKEGGAFTIAMQTFVLSRPYVAAEAVGIAQGAFEIALNYAKQRVQFGKTLAQNQAIQFKLADMALKIEAARNLYLKAAWCIDNGTPDNTLSSMCKWYASDVAMEVSTDAVQILGGNGYTRDYDAEIFMRDAKIFQIFEGTVEAQKMIVSGALLR